MSRMSMIGTLVLLSLIGRSSGQEASAEQPVPEPVAESLLQQLGDLHLLEPAWSSPQVHRESGVLLVEDDGQVILRLAFPAAEILSIRSADGRHQFDPRGDVRLDETRHRLTFIETGPVPRIAESSRFVPRDAPMSYRHRVDDPETNLLYAPGRWFHDRNVEVTYRRADLPDDAKAEAAASAASVAGQVRADDDRDAFDLPQTLQLLRDGSPLRIGISGDSISTGLDASYKVGAEPNQPGYVELIAAQLQQSSGSPITTINRSVAGWSVAHGLEDLETLLATEPNLLIVAYGMNDVGRRDPTWFLDRNAELIARARELNPQIEILLVAPMLGNDDWIHTPRAMFGEYRDQLRSLTGPGVALADLTEVWTILLRHKDDLDLTGNGLNHPNDFGHRLYAQAILEGLLVKR